MSSLRRGTGPEQAEPALTDQLARAEKPVIPQSLRDEMARIGPIWATDKSGHIQLMLDRFSALHAKAKKATVVIQRDLAYGSDERQKLDVFLPSRAHPARSTVLFVHGGAFTDGHRNRTPEIYSNVLRYFAEHGHVGVNIGYRLAPEAAYPSASVDIDSAIRFILERKTDFGLDAERLFLMGHSAGGGHAASYAYNPDIHGAGGPSISGLILISGRVRADMSPENPNAERVAAYYGYDPAVHEQVSAVNHLTDQSVPTFIAIAEYENPLIDLYGLELAYKISVIKRRVPDFVRLKDHNHTSVIAHLNTAEDVLGSAIRRFIAETSTAQQREGSTSFIP